MNEFSIIKKYLRSLTKKNDGSLSLSDDVFYDKNKKLVISVDTYVDKIHFINPENPNFFIKKVLRSSISDLYCKGVIPKKYFLSFALPNKFVKNPWLVKIKSILKNEQKKFNISLAGGDTTRSNILTITIVTIGYSDKKIVTRSGAKNNDDVYVTGNLGDSYLGLQYIKNKPYPKKYKNYFIKKFCNPDLQFRFAKYLSLFANSSIDISDGFYQDLSHICKNSKVGANINVYKLPLSHKLKKMIKEKNMNLFRTINNGDDYQIIFTAKKKFRSKIKNCAKKSKTRITRIGLINSLKKINFYNKSEILSVDLKKTGYMHTFK